MSELKYLTGYPDQVRNQVKALIENKTLSEFLLNKYPTAHVFSTNKALYSYVPMLWN